MSDSIDREAAIAAVRGKLCPVAVLRTLPAVEEKRRCDTCFYWHELRADANYGDCWANTTLPTWRRTHYCAAYRARGAGQ